MSKNSPRKGESSKGGKEVRLKGLEACQVHRTRKGLSVSPVSGMWFAGGGSERDERGGQKIGRSQPKDVDSVLWETNSRTGHHSYLKSSSQPPCGGRQRGRRGRQGLGRGARARGLRKPSLSGASSALAPPRVGASPHGGSRRAPLSRVLAPGRNAEGTPPEPRAGPRQPALGQGRGAEEGQGWGCFPQPGHRSCKLRDEARKCGR